MYELHHFTKKVCRHISIFDSTDKFSIWNARNPLTECWNNFMKLNPCRPEYFPIIYWLVVLFSVAGFMLSIIEFFTMYRGSKGTSTFRSRKYRVIPSIFRKNVRLVTAVFMAKAYLLLLAGITLVIPTYFTPWLVLQGLTFGIDIGLWLFDIPLADDCLQISHVLSYVCFGLLWVCVKCIKDVFEAAIENDEIEDLKLLPDIGYFIINK